MNVRRVGSCVSAYFFEIHGIDAAGDLKRLLEPLAEAQVAHAATLEATGPEFGGAVDDAAAAVAHSPAGGAAQIEREDARDVVRGLGHDDLLFGLAAGAKPLSGEGGASPGPERGLVRSVAGRRGLLR